MRLASLVAGFEGKKRSWKEIEGGKVGMLMEIIVNGSVGGTEEEKKEDGGDGEGPGDEEKKVRGCEERETRVDARSERR